MKTLPTRKFYALCGAIGLLAGVSPALAVNLLLNPGFESPAAPDPGDPNVSTQIAGWSFVGDTARSKFHGSHDAGGQWNVWLKTFVDQTGGVQQTLTAQPNSLYTLSAWNWFETNTNQTGSIFRMQLTWLDGGGGSVGTPATFNLDPVGQPISTWTQRMLAATSPAGTAAVRVFLGFEFGGGGMDPRSAFWDDAMLDGPGNAPSTSQWAPTTSGDWNVAGNWVSGTVPNSIGAQADFLGGITAPATVYSNTAITVGTINFNNPNTFVISGAGSMTLQASAGNAFVNVVTGTHKLNLPLTIASNTTFNVAGGATLKISDPVTINTGRVVNQTGGGQVIYESIVNIQGNAGLIMGNTTHMAALNIASTGNATLSVNGSRVLKTDNLSIGANSRLDLTDNDMIVANGSYSTITGLISSARNSGSWNGSGITSSVAAVANPKNKTLGTITGAQFHTAQGANQLFDGFTVANSDILVKFTYYGDADLNGVVNFDDYSRIDSGFNSGGSTWFQGDFDYNNQVNFDDYSLIDNAFNTQSGSLRQAIAYLDGSDRNDSHMDTPALELVVEHFAQFGEGYAQGFLNAVPEPTSALALSGLAVLAASSRRRRSA
ncbi:hypothetical protein BH09PLA1_BH09PLA1_26980 [soil metagenome]